MKLAIVTFTANGKKISENIREKLNNSECHIYTFYRYSSGETFTFTDGKELIRNIWNRYDFIIFIDKIFIEGDMGKPNIWLDNSKFS